MAKPLDNELRRHILRELSLKRNRSFSELFDKKRSFTSSRFAYHLKWLVDNEYVLKADNTYSLAKRAKQLVNYISLDSFEQATRPLVVLAVMIRHKNKVLCSVSKKEPLVGLWGMSCYGKYSSGNIIDALKQLCKEKTGYDVSSFSFGGVYAISTTDIGLRHQLLLFVAKDFSGELIKETPTRINRWMTCAQRKQYRFFPEMEFVIDNHAPSFFDMQRSIGEGTFKLLLKLI